MSTTCYACGQELLPEIVLPVFHYGRGIYLVDTERLAVCPDPDCKKKEGGGGYYRGRAVPDEYLLNQRRPLFLHWHGSGWVEREPSPAIGSRWQKKGRPHNPIVTVTSYVVLDDVEGHPRAIGVRYDARGTEHVGRHDAWHEKWEEAP